MKRIKVAFLALSIFIAGNVFSQDEFKKEWEVKVSVDPKWNGRNDDLSLVLVGNLKEMEMLDGMSGKTLWKYNVKEKLGVKSVEDWWFLTNVEGEPIKIVYKKPKSSENTTIYLNPKTAEEITVTEKEKEVLPAKHKSKVIFASSAFDVASSTVVMVDYKDRLIKSAMNGTEMEVTIKAVGGYDWSTNIKAKCVSHLCNNLLSIDEPEMMLSVMTASEKVFVIYEGISVLDLKTGKLLWNTTFDNVATSVGLKATQEIGRSPMPVVDNDAVYICDFSKGEKAIKKLDINSGAELWRGDKLGSGDVVSQLLVINNTLIAKFGGIVRKEKYIPSSNGGGTYKVNYDYEAESDIRAYDVTTGKQLWNSEKLNNGDKFSKSECTILVDNGKLIACSDKSFCIIDPATGNTVTRKELAVKQIGKPEGVFLVNDNYVVECEEGIASFARTGDLKYAVETGKTLFTEFRGEAFLIWTGKDIDDMNEFIRFDLATGKIFGKLKGTYQPRFDTSGNYFIRFKDELVTKFKTN